MKRLFALLGVWSLVYTEDFDGEIRLKVVLRNNPISGGLWVHGIGCFGRYRLVSDGTVSPTYTGYVTRWKEWPHNRRKISF